MVIVRRCVEKNIVCFFPHGCCVVVCNYANYSFFLYIYYTQKFICVDCGTYCGYSALVLASTLREIANELQNSISEDEDTETNQFEFHIYTTDVSAKLINVAQSVFRMAKMEQCITPMLMMGDGKESLAAALKNEGVTNVDFLLLDHAKNLYLSDLNDLEYG